MAIDADKCFHKLYFYFSFYFFQLNQNKAVNIEINLVNIRWNELH